MKSSAENLSPTRVRLSVEVPFDELKPSLDAAYKKIGSQLRVPGFRPGKVPARIIDQRVGRLAVLEEAVSAVVPRKYVEAARELEIQALGQPDIELVTDVSTLGENEPFIFTAEVDVRPEINLPDLDGLAVTVDDVEVSDADIDEQFEELRDRFGTLTSVERPVQSGDYVAIDLAASVDGEAIEAGTANGMSYEVGSGDLIEGLDDALIGARAGDTVTFTATLQQGDQVGTAAQINATVHSVKEKELPAVDDEFAQLASEFDTVAELRDDLATRIERAKTLQQGAQARDKLVEQLIASVDFEVPESALTTALEQREHEIVHALDHDDALFEHYLKTQGKTREEFTAELREGAEKAVRAEFILDAAAAATNVQVGNEELTEYLVRQAARYEVAPQDFAKQVVDAGNVPAMVADVRRNKALAALLASAAITDASGNRVDLSLLAPSAPSDTDSDTEYGTESDTEPAADDQVAEVTEH